MALHVGAFAEWRLVGVISLFRDGGSFQFRKLAVLEDFRGHSIGSSLVKECIAIASNNGAEMLWCMLDKTLTFSLVIAIIGFVNFYKKLGFEIDSAVFTKSGVLYQKAFLVPQHAGGQDRPLQSKI